MKKLLIAIVVILSLASCGIEPRRAYSFYVSYSTESSRYNIRKIDTWNHYQVGDKFTSRGIEYTVTEETNYYFSSNN